MAGAARIASWRFAGLDGAPEGPVTALTGGVALTEGDQAIRQSIMILLSTVPGERVMRPDYGCPLFRVVLAPNDATTAGLAIHYVRQAIQQFERRIDIISLDAGRDQDDPARLVIWLRYRIRSLQREDTLSLALDLAGPPG